MFVVASTEFSWAITKALLILVFTFASVLGLAWIATRNILPK
jgi:hypothetical protein